MGISFGLPDEDRPGVRKYCCVEEKRDDDGDDAESDYAREPIGEHSAIKALSSYGVA
jgi:hypothetical protein